jgi:Tfp pilus assembly protein PilN
MSINLLPWRVSLYKKSRKRVLIEGSISLILAFLCFYIFQSKTQRILTNQEKQIGMLEQTISSLLESYEEALSDQNRRNEEQKRENFLKSKSDINQTLFQLIENVSDQMPDAIYLSEIKRKENNLYFLGKSPSHAEFSKFLTQVKSHINKQPMVTETSQAEGQNGEISFEIVYEFGS